MSSFSFCSPGKVMSGVNSTRELNNILEECLSRKVFLISDKGLKESGILEKVLSNLNSNKYEVNCFLDVEANPSVETVTAATKEFRETDSDTIIAVGGGSPMDVAKAVAILAKYGGTIQQYEGAHKVPGSVVPILAIPTTAGTGSEVTSFSVITDHNRNTKFTIFSYEIIPKYAILDASLMATLPAHIAASTGIDAIIHASEAYISLYSSPFTDAMSEKALSLLGENIRRFVSNRADEVAAQNMMNGSMFAGIAFSWARLGNVHAMSHPISAFFNVPHGVANAVLFPHILRYNALADRGRYRTIYNYISQTKIYDNFQPEQLIETVEQLNSTLNIPKKLSDVNVTKEKIPEMAKMAMESGNIQANPRTSTVSDICSLYLQAL